MLCCGQSYFFFLEDDASKGAKKQKKGNCHNNLAKSAYRGVRLATICRSTLPSNMRRPQREERRFCRNGSASASQRQTFRPRRNSCRELRLSLCHVCGALFSRPCHSRFTFVARLCHQSWRGCVTLVALLCHVCRNIVSQTWHNVKCRDILLLRNDGKFRSNGRRNARNGRRDNGTGRPAARNANTSRSGVGQKKSGHLQNDCKRPDDGRRLREAARTRPNYFRTPSSRPTLMKAAIHLSRCSRSWPALIWTRIRA